MNRTKRMLAALALLFGLVGQTRAGLIVDQSFQYDSSLGGEGYGIQDFSPIGVSFVPTLSSVDRVQLGLFEVPSDGPGATMLVNIREGTIQGAILGTSSEITLAAYTGQVFPEIHDFTFANAVSLTPGNDYVIEVVQDSGPTWYLEGQGSFSGPLGNAIVSGTARTGFNFIFAEGIDSPSAASPEPSSLILLGIGSAGLVGYGWRRRRRNA